MAKQKLSMLEIRETSGVDVGAGDNTAIKIRKNALHSAEMEAYLKRQFTPEQRENLTSSGAAMPGGAFPIQNTKDLKNAVRAIGRAKNPGKTKAHIVSRARALGATGILPDKWVKKSIQKSYDKIASVLKSEGGEDFYTELGEMMSLDYGEGLQEAIHDSCHAMTHSIDSIMNAPDVTDKGAAIRGSFGQFLDHVQTLAPEGDVAKLAKRAKEELMSRAFNKAYTSVGTSDNTARRQEIDQKTGKLVTVIDDEEDPAKDSPEHNYGAATATKKMKRWRKRFETVVKMSKDDKESKDYMDSPDCDMDDDVKKQFIDMTKSERKVYMDANPIDERAMQKRLEGLPSEVRKQLELGREAAEKLAKRESEEALDTFTKRAIAARLPKDLGPELVKLHKADREALSRVMEAVDVMAKSAQATESTGFIFKEFGTARGADITGTAYETLMQKSQDAADQGKFATPEQAFAAFYTSRDPEIRTLIKRGKAEGSL